MSSNQLNQIKNSADLLKYIKNIFKFTDFAKLGSRDSKGKFFMF